MTWTTQERRELVRWAHATIRVYRELPQHVEAAEVPVEQIDRLELLIREAEASAKTSEGRRRRDSALTELREWCEDVLARDRSEGARMRVFLPAFHDALAEVKDLGPEDEAAAVETFARRMRQAFRTWHASQQTAAEEALPRK